MALRCIRSAANVWQLLDNNGHRRTLARDSARCRTHGDRDRPPAFARVFSVFKFVRNGRHRVPPDAVVGAPVPPGLRAFELEGDGTSWQEAGRRRTHFEKFAPGAQQRKTRALSGERGSSCPNDEPLRIGPLLSRGKTLCPSCCRLEMLPPIWPPSRSPRSMWPSHCASVPPPWRNCRCRQVCAPSVLWIIQNVAATP